MSRPSLLVLALGAVVAASVAGPVHAVEFEVGAAAGSSHYRIDTTGATRSDTRDSAGKLFVGATFTPYLALEADVFDLGQASGSVFVPGIGTVDVSSKVRGAGLSGRLGAPIGPVSLFAKLGAAHVRASVSSSVRTELPGSESSWQPKAGLGLSYAVARQFAVRGEWERVRTRFPGGERDDVDLLSVGVSYRF